jgi:uncharacterized protein (DUF1697 family)
MPTYVALLRGINVTGTKPLSMEALRASFAALGYKDVRTYVQSGNVIFTATGKPDSESLARRVKGRILKDFGYDVPVTVLTAAEIATTFKGNPFLRKKDKEKGVDLARLHVTFLADRPKAPALASLEAILTGKDRYCVVDRRVYLHTPDGYGRTKLNNNVLEKKLGTVATTRNWNTITQLYELTR